MAIDDNPITVFNRQLRQDEESSSMISPFAKATDALTQVPILKPLSPLAKGLNIVDKCLSLGVPTVEQNLRQLGELIENAVLRTEEQFDEHSTEIENLKRHIESDKFTQFMAAAVLQTQRTAQVDRLKRMAWIVVNSATDDDLDLESGDDMLRAAIELKGVDIRVLSAMTDSIEVNSYDVPVNEYWWSNCELRCKNKISGLNQKTFNSALSRLQSFGYVYPAGITNDATTLSRTSFMVSDEGEKFLKRVSVKVP